MALLHGGLIWAMTLGFVQRHAPPPPSSIVHVMLLPAKRQTELPPPPMPRLLSEPAIAAIPPQVTIAVPRDGIRAVPARSPKPFAHQAQVSIAPEPPPLDYLSRLAAHLNAYKSYPYEARIRRQEGTVQLRFTLGRAGNVLSFDVIGSSGVSALDREAREMVQRANPFPPLPKKFPGPTLELEVPVIFSLH